MVAQSKIASGKITKHGATVQLQVNGGKHTISMMDFQGKNLTRSQVRNYVQQLSNDAKEMGLSGLISVAVGIKEIGAYRSTKRSEVGEHVNVYDNTDSDLQIADPRIDDFTVYIYSPKERAGGCDGKLNDCFLDIVKRVFPGKYKKTWHRQYKAKWGLKQDAKIPIELMKTVEDEFDIAINVRGDYVYISQSTSAFKVDLILRDGHFTVDEGCEKYTSGTLMHAKKFLVYDPQPAIVNTYDGKKHDTITTTELSERLKHPADSKHMLIRKKEGLTMEETFKQFTKFSTALKTASKGKIDMNKSGSERKTAEKLFDSNTSTFNCEPIKQDEAIWINYASFGAIIYAVVGYEGYAKEFDFISKYPAIMRDNHFMIPFKRGEFSTMTQEEFDNLEKMQVSIYRCEITGSSIFWKGNPKNYYTSIDIRVAQALGFTIELIQDDQPNALIWTREKLKTGTQIFGTTVDELFALKKAKIAGAKEVLNSLWGSLVRSNGYDIFQSNTQIEVYDGREIEYICPSYSDRNKQYVRFEHQLRPFMSNWARFKPFILAKGRASLFNTFKDYEKYIVKMHTDSAFLSKDIDIKTGTDMGDLVVKYEGMIKINNRTEKPY